MKKSDVLNIYNSLNNSKLLGSAKFKYCIIKNINIIKCEVDTLLTIQKEIKDILIHFEKDRYNLIKEIGNEDTLTGTVTIDKNNAEAMAKFNEGHSKLLEKYSTIIKTYEDKMNEFNAILDEDAGEFEFKRISIDNCPDDVGGKDLELLMQFEIVE